MEYQQKENCQTNTPNPPTKFRTKNWVEKNDGSHGTCNTVIFKNCAPPNDCINIMNDTQIDNAKYIDVVMLMSNSNKYSNNYSKTSESLWQYYKDDPNDNKKQSDSFTCRIKVTGKTPAVGNTNDVEIAVPLKYLSNF